MLKLVINLLVEELCSPSAANLFVILPKCHEIMFRKLNGWHECQFNNWFDQFVQFFSPEIDLSIVWASSSFCCRDNFDCRSRFCFRINFENLKPSIDFILLSRVPTSSSFKFKIELSCIYLNRNPLLRLTNALYYNLYFSRMKSFRISNER